MTFVLVVISGMLVVTAYAARDEPRASLAYSLLAIVFAVWSYLAE